MKSLGFLLGEQGRHKEVEKIYHDILEFNQDDAGIYFNLACLYGLQLKISESIKYLKRAIDKDPKYKEMARTDNDFDLIRDTPKFQELLKYNPDVKTKSVKLDNAINLKKNRKKKGLRKEGIIKK